MAKERLFDLPETKGQFQLKGVVTGTEKENFYKETKTKNKKDFRAVNFGLAYQDGKNVYLSMTGMPQENVYFSKPSKEKGKKGETKKVKWSDRASYKEEGFRLIGNNIGVTKITDEKGNSVNNKKVLVDFDSCKEIGANLKDDMSVFTKGKIDYSEYEDKNGTTKRSIKLVPTQVSLCGDIDFESETYKPQHDFTQVIIFTGVVPEKVDGKATGRFIISAKIVNYKEIEDAEFITKDEKLAMIFKKNIKPYNAIEVWGKIETATLTETTTDDDDCWGEENEMTKVSAPYKVEFIITGASKTSLDTDTYTEKTVENAIAKIKQSKNAESDFADTTDDDWGSTSDFNGSTDEDDDDPWA